MLATDVGSERGVTTREWGDGLWSVRTRAAPERGPGNQLTGLTPETLDRLDEIIPWFDEAGCSMRIRWPGAEVDQTLGRRLAGLGFCVEELEAWLAAPIDRLNIEAPPIDVRRVQTEEMLKDFAEAFCGGWKIPADKRRIATAAMASSLGPSFWRRYVAYVDGHVAGEGVMALFDEAGYLAEAATLPEFRRRGVQRAVIARRVQEAREAGVGVMFGCVQYGDQSWANMRALGLREVFMTVTFTRPPQR